MADKDVVITGYGLLSAHGETPDAWWPALNDPAAIDARIDRQTCAPFPFYPVAPHDIARQVPKPGDQRAMGPLMLYGCYAAGAALEMAGIKGNEELLLRTHLVAASGGGERDWELDRKIIEQLIVATDRQAVLNQQLADGLRPTLFLAQLPNLFAGNISLVHGVSGSSRTFMGEEAAGVDALRIGFERIKAGQGDLFLIGAAYNAARPDMMWLFNAGDLPLRGEVTNLWRRPPAGIAFGSAGAFLVVESRAHAEKRGAAPLARLRAVKSGRSRRGTGGATAIAAGQWQEIGPQTGDGLAVLSGACGAGGITAEERLFLERTVQAERGAPVRGTARAFGHSLEATLLLNLIVGLSCLQKGEMFAALSPEEPLEQRAAAAPIRQILATSWGCLVGEGMALMESIDV
ncbi:MAG: beta-ketoacyl-ACP synthase [Alphaproteobacteria bacterium]